MKKSKGFPLGDRLPRYGGGGALAPEGEQLSAKRTDEGQTFRDNPVTGNSDTSAPHPASLCSATFPLRGRQK